MIPTVRTAPGRRRVRPPGTLATSLAILAAALIALAGCEGPTGPKGPLGAGPDGLTDPSIVPQVIYTYPPTGAEGPYPELYLYECPSPAYPCGDYLVIRLRFNKIMDIASVRGAVRLSAASGTGSISPGGVLPLGGDIFMIHPANAIGQRIRRYVDIGERYRLTVDTTALDVNGNRLRTPFELSFTPEPFFRVVGTIPADGTLLPGLATPISISFNAPVDSSILAHVRIDPPPVYGPVWSILSGLPIVYGSIPVRGSTTYTVTVDTPAADARGNRIPAPFTWSFSTTPLRVISVRPTDGQTGVPLSASISVNFSEPVDTSTLRGAFHITPGVIYGISSWDGQSVTIYPRTELQPNTAYTMVLDSTLRSKAGASLREPFSSIFTTGPLPPFQVSYSSPGDGAPRVDGRLSIQLWFNREIDTSSVPGAFHLEPPRPGRFHYDGDRRTITYNPDFQLTMGEGFQVTLDTTLRAADGGRLAEAYHLTFVVRPLEVAWISPADGQAEVPPTARLRVSLSGAIDTATLRGAFTIDPPATGVLLIDWTSFAFIPSGAWTPEVNYTVRLDTTLLAEGGGRLSGPFVSTFRTAPFSIIGFDPADGFEGHPLTGPVWISCNDTVDTASAKSALRMTDSTGTGVPGDFFFSAAFPDQFVFRSSAPLRPAQWYEVTISTALRSTHGHPITSAFHRRFRTVP